MKTVAELKVRIDELEAAIHIAKTLIHANASGRDLEQAHCTLEFVLDQRKYGGNKEIMKKMCYNILACVGAIGEISVAEAQTAIVREFGFKDSDFFE